MLLKCPYFTGMFQTEYTILANRNTVAVIEAKLRSKTSITRSEVAIKVPKVVISQETRSERISDANRL